jgi:butyrate kinase
MTERELVLEYKTAKDEVDELDEKLKTAKDRFKKAQEMLIEELQSKGASQTAKYDGVGRITILKPLVGARSLDEEKLFAYLKDIGRDDLMKLTVHHRTLSAFVKERLDQGSDIPDFVEYWYTPSTRLNK